MQIKRKSVVVFYNNQNQLILQDRSNINKEPKIELGFWGGGIEKGETSLQAIVREIKEELNLDISSQNLYYFYSSKSVYTGQIIERDVYISYWDYDLSQVQVNEGKEVLFLTVEETLAKMVLKADREIVQKFDRIWDRI